MSEILTDAQLAEREAAYQRWAEIHDVPAKSFYETACEQEPALIARLREADRLMEERMNVCRDVKKDCDNEEGIMAYFARVRQSGTPGEGRTG